MFVSFPPLLKNAKLLYGFSKDSSRCGLGVLCVGEPKQHEGVIDCVQQIEPSESKSSFFAELKGTIYILHNDGIINAYTYGNDSIEHVVSFRATHSFALVASAFSACDKNDRLYLGNRSDQSVYSVEFNDESYALQGFTKLHDISEYPQSLSAFPDGRLGMLVAVTGSFLGMWQGRLEIYDSKTKYVQVSSRVPEWATSPWCFTYIDAERNTCAVSYGLFTSGVLIIDCKKDTVIAA